MVMSVDVECAIIVVVVQLGTPEGRSICLRVLAGGLRGRCPDGV